MPPAMPDRRTGPNDMAADRNPSRLALQPAFRRLAWSNLAAQSAEQIALAAAPLVAVTSFGSGPGETGMLQTVLTLPFVLLAVPAGLVADRFRRARVLAVAEAARSLALGAVVILLWQGALTFWLLAALGFLAVCGTVVFSVAAPALVPALVTSDALPLANARLELARTVAFAGGPALGGVLVGLTGAGFAFAGAVALSCLAAGLLARIEEPAPQGSGRRQPLEEIREGAVFVWRHPLLAPVFATQTIFNVGMFMILAVFVPHAVSTLGLSAEGVGLVLACYGIGMVAGALVAPTIIATVRFGAVVGIGPMTGVLAAFVLALTSLWPWPALAALGLFLFGVGPIVWVVSTATLRQAVTPASLLGRVSAVNILSYGARPIGSAFGAGIATVGGTSACLWAAFLLFAVQAATILLSPVVRLESRPVVA